MRFHLAQFYGTENWYRHGLIRSILYTDGVKYVAETGGAYWLIDEVAIAQMQRAIRGQVFQVWKLKVTGESAVLTCEDGNNNLVSRKKITFTDFPLPEITFWLRDNVIMLPSEY